MKELEDDMKEISQKADLKSKQAMQKWKRQVAESGPSTEQSCTSSPGLQVEPWDWLWSKAPFAGLFLRK